MFRVLAIEKKSRFLKIRYALMQFLIFHVNSHVKTIDMHHFDKLSNPD